MLREKLLLLRSFNDDDRDNTIQFVSQHLFDENFNNELISLLINENDEKVVLLAIQVCRYFKIIIPNEYYMQILYRYRQNPVLIHSFGSLIIEHLRDGLIPDPLAFHSDYNIASIYLISLYGNEDLEFSNVNLGTIIDLFVNCSDMWTRVLCSIILKVFCERGAEIDQGIIDDLFNSNVNEETFPLMIELFSEYEKLPESSNKFEQCFLRIKELTQYSGEYLVIKSPFNHQYDMCELVRKLVSYYVSLFVAYSFSIDYDEVCQVFIELTYVSHQDLEEWDRDVDSLIRDLYSDDKDDGDYRDEIVSAISTIGTISMFRLRAGILIEDIEDYYFTVLYILYRISLVFHDFEMIHPLKNHSGDLLMSLSLYLFSKSDDFIIDDVKSLGNGCLFIAKAVCNNHKIYVSIDDLITQLFEMIPRIETSLSLVVFSLIIELFDYCEIDSSSLIDFFEYLISMFDQFFGNTYVCISLCELLAELIKKHDFFVILFEILVHYVYYFLSNPQTIVLAYILMDALFTDEDCFRSIFPQNVLEKFLVSINFIINKDDCQSFEIQYLMNLISIYCYHGIIEQFNTIVFDIISNIHEKDIIFLADMLTNFYIGSHPDYKLILLNSLVQYQKSISQLDNPQFESVFSQFFCCFISFISWFDSLHPISQTMIDDTIGLINEKLMYFQGKFEQKICLWFLSKFEFSINITNLTNFLTFHSISYGDSENQVFLFSLSNTRVSNHPLFNMSISSIINDYFSIGFNNTIIQYQYQLRLRNL